MKANILTDFLCMNIKLAPSINKIEQIVDPTRLRVVEELVKVFKTASFLSPTYLELQLKSYPLTSPKDTNPMSNDLKIFETICKKFKLKFSNFFYV